MKVKRLYNMLEDSAGGEVGKRRMFDIRQGLYSVDLIPEMRQNLGIRNAAMFVYMLFLCRNSQRQAAGKFAEKSAKEIHPGHPLHAIHAMLSDPVQAGRVGQLTFDRREGAMYMRLNDGTWRAYFTGPAISQEMVNAKIKNFINKPIKNTVTVEGSYLELLAYEIQESIKEAEKIKQN